jgi:tetratricopeptide (TPR) repeat protein
VTTRELAREGVRRVAREFDADHVVSGTLMRIDDRLRVTCSLVDGRRATQSLAETLEGALRELPDIERQIVNAIAVELRLAVPRRSEGAPAPSASAEQLLLARSYLQRQDSEASIDGAIRLLEALGGQGDAGVEVWAELSRAYRHKHHHTRERVWLERAMSAAERSMAEAPGSAEALVAVAHGHLLLGRHEEAESEFRLAAERRPELKEPHSGLATLHVQRGDLDAAEAESRRAIAIRPGDWNDHNRLGEVLYRKGRYADAIEAWQQAARLTPDNPTPYFNMGAALFQLGRRDEAEQSFRASLERQPSSGALAGLGTVLFARNDFAGALDAFERATTLSPNNPVFWGNLAGVLRWMPGEEGRSRHAVDRAVALAREQLTLNPRRVDLMADLADWLAAAGEFDQARQWIARALDLDPGNGHNLVHAVSIHEAAGDRVRALEALEQALARGISWEEVAAARDLESLRLSPEGMQLRARSAPRADLGGSSPEQAPRPEVQS